MRIDVKRYRPGFGITHHLKRTVYPRTMIGDYRRKRAGFSIARHRQIPRYRNAIHALYLHIITDQFRITDRNFNLGNHLHRNFRQTRKLTIPEFIKVGRTLRIAYHLRRFSLRSAHRSSQNLVRIFRILQTNLYTDKAGTIQPRYILRFPCFGQSKLALELKRHSSGFTVLNYTKFATGYRSTFICYTDLER